MIASNISFDVLLHAAETIGCEIEANATSGSGKRFRVKLYPKPEPKAFNAIGTRYRGERGDAPYQRISASMYQNERRVNAVCWHGFRDFFRACFAVAPNAKFKTAIDTWNGAEDFEDRFRDTGYKNIGSAMYPVSMVSACRCPESGCV